MDIQQTLFGPRQYLALRKSIATSQISDKRIYEEAGKKLGAYMQQEGVLPIGVWSVLYFVWDEAANRTDIAIAFPVAGIDVVTDPELSVVTIPEYQAVSGVLRGSYEGLKAAHNEMLGYMKQHDLAGRGLAPFAVEEYTVDPSTEQNQDKLITNIYYFYK